MFTMHVGQCTGLAPSDNIYCITPTSRDHQLIASQGREERGCHGGEVTSMELELTFNNCQQCKDYSGGLETSTETSGQR